jgi:aspartyl-tRNA synthetase
MNLAIIQASISLIRTRMITALPELYGITCHSIYPTHSLNLKGTRITIYFTYTMAEPVQDPVPASAPAEGETPAGPSKSELKKRAKEAEKAKKAAERLAREEEERKAREAAASVDNASQNYGKLPLHQSQERTGRDRLKFPQLNEDLVGKEVIFRARLHNMRPQGAKIVFLQFRQQTETLQGVLVASGEKDEHQVSKQMLKFAQGITVGSPPVDRISLIKV